MKKPVSAEQSFRQDLDRFYDDDIVVIVEPAGDAHQDFDQFEANVETAVIAKLDCFEEIMSAGNEQVEEIKSKLFTKKAAEKQETIPLDGISFAKDRANKAIYIATPSTNVAKQVVDALSEDMKGKFTALQAYGKDAGTKPLALIKKQKLTIQSLELEAAGAGVKNLAEVPEKEIGAHPHYLELGVATCCGESAYGHSGIGLVDDAIQFVDEHTTDANPISVLAVYRHPVYDTPHVIISAGNDHEGLRKEMNDDRFYGDVSPDYMSAQDIIHTRGQVVTAQAGANVGVTGELGSPSDVMG